MCVPRVDALVVGSGLDSISYKTDRRAGLHMLTGEQNNDRHGILRTITIYMGTN